MKDHENKPVKLDSLCKSWSQVHTVDQTVHPPTSIALLASVCLSAAGPLRVKGGEIEKHPLEQGLTHTHTHTLEKHARCPLSCAH